MSRLPFELLLALRYLRPKRTFVSVITLIAVVGVTLGVTVLIVVIAVMTGFGEQFESMPQQERIEQGNVEEPPTTAAASACTADMFGVPVNGR